MKLDVNVYNNFVSTLKLVRKHRPFAENDNLPKICQPEDHIEVSSPQSSSDDDDENNRPHEERKDAIKAENNQGDEAAAEFFSEDEDHLPKNAANGCRSPDMGPNCNLKSLFGEDESAQKQDRFSRLSAMAEERKVNLFYLKDTLLNKDVPLHDRLDAMAQIRKNVNLPVFKFAIESVLSKFHSIPELCLQVEIINIIGKSQ